MSVPTLRRRFSGAVAVLLVAATVVAGGASTAGAQTSGIDCSNDSMGNIPLTDLGSGTFMDAQGGLYPGGSNEIPEDHRALGLDRAAEITPRNSAGDPDPNGAIAFVSLGISNTKREFTAFQSLAGSDPDVADSIVLVNGAQTGKGVNSWLDPNDSVWQEFGRALNKAGVTAEQVQAAWVKIPERFNSQPLPFPDNVLEYRNELTAALRTIQTKLPNLEVAYLSSRIYGGYAVTSANPEPNAYQEGFGVKWVIEAQMAGNPLLNADPDQGEVVAPWVAWGPYIWADGTTPRADGLTWDCNEMMNDGVHPNPSGSAQVAEMLLDSLRADPTADWFFGEPVDDSSEPSGATVTTSTIPGDPGLTAETLPVPGAAAPPGGAPGGGGAGEEPGAGDNTDTTRRERGDRNREGAGRTTTTDPGGATGSDSTAVTGSTLATVTVGERGSVPPIVWVLVAIGALLLGALAVRAMRRDRSQPPDPDVTLEQ
ncbi:MAG: hypothetical protein H0V96_03790 [Acidimicrobiia bacterium]|nr:hypothetical protein [Acidimicrobiia bacterium]